MWPGAVLRGDYGTITVGARTSVQDGTVIHAGPGFPTVVGDGCVIGHLAHLEGCVLEDECLVGSGSVVLHHAVIGTGATVGANAVVPNRMEVPPGALALGRSGRHPARGVQPGPDPGRRRPNTSPTPAATGRPSSGSTEVAGTGRRRTVRPGTAHPRRPRRRRQNLAMHGTLTFDGRPPTGHPGADRSSGWPAAKFFWLDLDGVDDEAHDLLLERLQDPPARRRGRPELRPAAQARGLRRLHVHGGPRRRGRRAVDRRGPLHPRPSTS